jgi:hypothetical protein
MSAEGSAGAAHSSYACCASTRVSTPSFPVRIAAQTHLVMLMGLRVLPIIPIVQAETGHGPRAQKLSPPNLLITLPEDLPGQSFIRASACSTGEVSPRWDFSVVITHDSSEWPVCQFWSETPRHQPSPSHQCEPRAGAFMITSVCLR